MREAGIIGQARSKMDPAEKKAHRKAYSKQYRKKITAEAKAYREMMKRGQLFSNRVQQQIEEVVGVLRSREGHKI